MEFPYLPINALIDILLPLSTKEVQDFCQANVSVLKTCNGNEFFNDMLIRKYQLKIADIPGITLKEKYEYITKLYMKAETSNISIARGRRDNREFGNIIAEAVKSNNVMIVESVIRILYSRIQSQDYGYYSNSFTVAFIEAIKLENMKIIQRLSLYYEPREDAYFDEYVREVIIDGDIETFKTVLPYRQPNSIDYELAVTEGQFDIAEYIRFIFIIQGSELNDEAQGLYMFAVQNNRRDILDYLIKYFEPDMTPINRIAYNKYSEEDIYEGAVEYLNTLINKMNMNT